MLIVAALGGNALLRRGEPLTHEHQQANVRAATQPLAALAAEHRLIITHGNGPQVGLLALNERKREHFPLDVLVAETQGMIGYVLGQELQNALPGRAVACVLTRIVVDPDDPAFDAPTKPIGPVYTPDETERLRARKDWAFAPDGDGRRRVVASPEPRGIVELETIRLLLDRSTIVICGGGGGIPVTVAGDGSLAGVEAVVDKDLTAALLAERVDADLLLLLTDVEAAERDWGTAAAVPIRETTPSELRELDFAAGSMGPKIEACCRFVERTGRRAALGDLRDAVGLVAGTCGTQIRLDEVSAARHGSPGSREYIATSVRLPRTTNAERSTPSSV